MKTRTLASATLLVLYCFGGSPQLKATESEGVESSSQNVQNDGDPTDAESISASDASVYAGHIQQAVAHKIVPEDAPDWIRDGLQIDGKGNIRFPILISRHPSLGSQPQSEEQQIRSAVQENLRGTRLNDEFPHAIENVSASYIRDHWVAPNIEFVKTLEVGSVTFDQIWIQIEILQEDFADLKRLNNRELRFRTNQWIGMSGLAILGCVASGTACLTLIDRRRSRTEKGAGLK